MFARMFPSLIDSNPLRSGEFRAGVCRRAIQDDNLLLHRGWNNARASRAWVLRIHSTEPMPVTRRKNLP